MNRRHSAAVVAMVGLLVASAAGQGNTLIYSDQSEGVLLMASVLKDHGQTSGSQLCFVTSQAEFQSQLACGGWTTVTVVARFTAAEPAYVTDVRQFSALAPQATVHLYLWHDQGRTIDDNLVVESSMAYVTWRQNATHICYVDAVDTSVGHPSGQRTLPGQAWPAWDSITPRRPTAILQIPAADLADRAAFDLVSYVAAHTMNGERRCLNFGNEADTCDTQHFLQVDYCRQLHDGAGQEQDLLECITEANQHHSNGVAAAMTRLKNCLKLSVRATALQSAEASYCGVR